MDLGIPSLGAAEEVGRGGFGVVYQAGEPKLNRTVAVKLLVTERLSREDSARFGKLPSITFG